MWRGRPRLREPPRRRRHTHSLPAPHHLGKHENTYGVPRKPRQLASSGSLGPRQVQPQEVGEDLLIDFRPLIR